MQIQKKKTKMISYYRTSFPYFIKNKHQGKIIQHIISLLSVAHNNNVRRHILHELPSSHTH